MKLIGKKEKVISVEIEVTPQELATIREMVGNHSNSSYRDMLRGQGKEQYLDVEKLQTFYDRLCNVERQALGSDQ